MRHYLATPSTATELKQSATRRIPGATPPRSGNTGMSALAAQPLPSAPILATGWNTGLSLFSSFGGCLARPQEVAGFEPGGLH